MSYQLILDVSGPGPCSGIELPREAIEFSMRSDSSRDGRWIPLELSYYDDNAAISTTSTEIVRGYEIPAQSGPDATSTGDVTICGDMLNTNEVQFRWMGTADVETNRLFVSDMWALARVTASLVTPNKTFVLIQDHFGGKTLK